MASTGVSLWAVPSQVSMATTSTRSLHGCPTRCVSQHLKPGQLHFLGKLPVLCVCQATGKPRVLVLVVGLRRLNCPCAVFMLTTVFIWPSTSPLSLCGVNAAGVLCRRMRSPTSSSLAAAAVPTPAGETGLSPVLQPAGLF